MMIMSWKRKAVDQVNHDFSDFSLSSPATKIRRLDHAELAPIMEEDEQQQQEESHMSSSSSSPFIQQETIPPPPASAAAIEEVENEERAIVLFNPNNTTNLSFHSPPTFSLNPHILSRFKGQSHLWSKHSNLLDNSTAAQQHKDTPLEKEEEDDHISNHCLAVVPWVHSHLSPPPQTAPPLVQQLDASETMMMETEQENQQETANMDIEQQEEYNNNGYAATAIPQRPATEFGGPSIVDFHQWQQQNCMVPPQLPHHAAAAPAAPAAAPVVWFR